jgi:hypothetical protein
MGKGKEGGSDGGRGGREGGRQEEVKRLATASLSSSPLLYCLTSSFSHVLLFIFPFHFLPPTLQASLQASLLPRPFPGVLPLGPSQISSVYRYHLLKLRVLSEGGREEGVGEAEGEYPYLDEPCRVQVGGGRGGGREEDAMVTSPPSSPLPMVGKGGSGGGEGGGGGGGGGGGAGGGGNKRGVGQRIEEEEAAAAATAAAGSRYPLKKEREDREEGGKEGGLCQRVLKAAVFGMGDDVFRELCDFVHLLDM